MQKTNGLAEALVETLINYLLLKGDIIAIVMENFLVISQNLTYFCGFFYEETNIF